VKSKTIELTEEKRKIVVFRGWGEEQLGDVGQRIQIFS
jgi:hypothetical protein